MPVFEPERRLPIPSIDYHRVKQLVTLGEVVQLLGIPWTRLSGHVVRGPCLACSHPDRRACRFDGWENLWYCHRCKVGGSALDLYAKVKRLSIQETAIELCELLHRELPLLGPPPSQKDKAVKD